MASKNYFFCSDCPHRKLIPFTIITIHVLNPYYKTVIMKNVRFFHQKQEEKGNPLFLYVFVMQFLV